MALIQIPAFLGERNTVDEKSMPLGALISSKNVDIDDSGLISKRHGYRESALFTNITSTFATSDERRMFIVDDGILKLVNQDFSAVDLKSGMPTGYVKWLEVADYILMSSGHIITNQLDVLEWRIPTPEQPMISTATGGSLPAGQYQVVSTYRDEHGREGAASAMHFVEVEGGAVINITPDFETGYESLVYISDTNGEVLYLLDTAEYSTGMTFSETNSLVYPIDRNQLDAGPLPQEIGSLAFYEGSVWASQYIDGVSYLWRSKPYWWHLFDQHEDYLSIPGKVTVLEGTPQGLFIGTDDEMYVYTIEESLVRLAEYGVMQGRPLARTDEGRLFVWTRQGVCTLFPFQNITEDKVSLSPGCLCSTAIIEKDGYEQFMVLNNGSGTAFNPLEDL